MSSEHSAPPIATELSRDLTLTHVTLMGVGMMIGAGVFVGMGLCLKAVGPGGTLMTFTLNAVIAMCSAMSYAELSSAIPKAGGAYNFARIAFGRCTSFFAGWLEWFASSVAGSLYAFTVAMYVLNFLSEENGIGILPWAHSDTHFSVRIFGVLAALLFAYINYRGSSETGKIGSLITIGQTATLTVVAALGFWVAFRNPERFANFQPFLPEGWFPILATMGLIYVAFEGFEVIAQAGDETIEPRKNLPKAMMLSVVIVAVTYAAVTVAAILAVPDLGGSWAAWIGGDEKILFSRIVLLLLPTGGGVLVVLAVLFSATSALNATTYSATRAVYALGRDGFLPAKVADISPKTRTPVTALFLTAGIIIVIVLALPVQDVAASASIMFLFLFLLVNLCAIRMRRHMGDELQYGYVMPLFPLPPILGIVAQVFLSVELRSLSPTAWIVAPVWLGLGAVVYLAYGRTHVQTSRDEVVKLEETPLPPKERFRILMPVANPDTVLQKVPQTMKIAKAFDAEVELLHMVEIPDQVPLTDAGKYMDSGKEAIAEAMLYLASHFPIRDTIRYCRNTARGILSAAREHQADLIVTGWRGRSLRRDFLFGSTIDPILERNPCDVILLKDCTERSYKRILVPFAGGPHSLLALKIASILISRKEGVIVPLNITRPGKPTVDIEAFLDKNAGQFYCAPDRFQPRYEVSRDVLGCIVGAARESDLIVIGATGMTRLRQFAGQISLPERLAAETDKPLIMVKAGIKVKSLLERYV